jgi:peptidoglycan/LPS O-acetylase OafA/YrhL
VIAWIVAAAAIAAVAALVYAFVLRPRLEWSEGGGRAGMGAQQAPADLTVAETRFLNLPGV